MYSQYFLGCRTSIVCHGASKILQAVRWFTQHEESTCLRVCRLKNKFAFEKDKLVGGYRDVMLCVLFIEDDGLRIIGEIQIQDYKLSKIKSKVLPPPWLTSYLIFLFFQMCGPLSASITSFFYFQISYRSNSQFLRLLKCLFLFLVG